MKTLLAFGMAAGLLSSQAAVFNINPGDPAQVLPGDNPAGVGGVIYSGDGSTAVVIAGVIGLGGTYDGAWILEDATDTVVATMLPGPIAGTAGFAFVAGVPSVLPQNTDLYIVIGNLPGGFPPAPQGIADITSAFTSQTFLLVSQPIPEPSTYAVLAGLGLVGFAGYRRFRS